MIKILTNFLWVAIIIISFLLLRKGCRSTTSMNEDQYRMFEQNRSVFNDAINSIRRYDLTDTIFFLSHDETVLSPGTVKGLDSIGIKEIHVNEQRCGGYLVSFIPGENWYTDKFGVVEISHSLCDERSKKGFKWHQEGALHKHSLGQGEGWFVYTDSDRDPF
jgi:hypothetical protein